MSADLNSLNGGEALWLVQPGDAPRQLVDDALNLLRNAGALVVASIDSMPDIPVADGVEPVYIGSAEFQAFAKSSAIDPHKAPNHKTSGRATTAYKNALTLGWRQFKGKNIATWIPPLQFDPPISDRWPKVIDVEAAQPSIDAHSLRRVAEKIKQRVPDTTKPQLHKFAGPGIDRRSIDFWQQVSAHYLDNPE